MNLGPARIASLALSAASAPTLAEPSDAHTPPPGCSLPTLATRAPTRLRLPSCLPAGSTSSPSAAARPQLPPSPGLASCPRTRPARLRKALWLHPCAGRNLHFAFCDSAPAPDAFRAVRFTSGEATSDSCRWHHPPLLGAPELEIAWCHCHGTFIVRHTTRSPMSVETLAPAPAAAPVPHNKFVTELNPKGIKPCVSLPSSLTALPPLQELR